MILSSEQYDERVYIVMRALLWVCAFLAAVFPFLYHWRSRGTWSFTPIGRHIMQFRAVFALLLIFTALAPFVHDGTILTISVVLFAITVGILINQIRFVISPETMDPQRVLADPDASPAASRLLLREEPPMKSRPVVITMSILAGLQFLFGGLSAMNLPGINSGYNATVLSVGAFGTLIVAAAQSGIQFYVQNLVTPHEDVAAFRDKHGDIVAGPAAPPEGESVDVVSEDSGRHRAQPEN